MSSLTIGYHWLYLIVILAMAVIPQAANGHQAAEKDYLYENDYILDVHHSGRRRITAVRCDMTVNYVNCNHLDLTSSLLLPCLLTERKICSM